MNALILTVIIATLLVLAALFALSLGWLNGKHKIKKGSYGTSLKKIDDSNANSSMNCNTCKNTDDS